MASWKSSVTLLCDSIGDPMPNIMWFYEKQMIDNDEDMKTSENGSLKIYNLQRKHSGRFSCIANNIHGKDSIHYYLRVQGKIDI